MLLAGDWDADPSAIPRLGQPLSADAVAKLAIHVFPDGEGLPAGSGSVQQGAVLYQQKCLLCHGPDGLGGSAEALAGAEMGLTSEWPEKTIGSFWPYATTLFDFIRRSMPMNAPASLSDNEVYALTAYLLFLNNIVIADTVLDKVSLMQVQMNNADGFINLYETTARRLPHSIVKPVP
ncbi:Sulfite dehydrogenase cytochrome subunit SoxD [uncultured Candidatus Thioglobus sp.]|nr:Sulfite dehydrogenase cytochrome subunit SoxD [uncultured Candidatus Thioglobus sp.]